MNRRAISTWQGSGLEGKGQLTVTSGVLNETPYSFKMRFEDEEGRSGTNPEELLAASHAGCFNMALSFQLVGAGYEAEMLETKCTVTLENVGGNDFGVTKIVLDLQAKVPGLDNDKFMELANNAKNGCPISKALSSVDIQMNAVLK
ncbi:MAG: OsmC family protein [Flavobacteriales bacterium]|nr:OsmC family protein [Flavobacteriales bacterium]